MKLQKRLLCALTVLCLLLTGCQMDFGGYFQRLGMMTGYGPVTDTSQIANPTSGTNYSQMTYTHPDMDAVRTTLDNLYEDVAKSGNLQKILNGIYAYYDVYDQFYTNYDLAYIHYCQDVTDTYWESEYIYCMENAPQLDAGLEELYYTLANSSWRKKLEGKQYFGPGFFEAYEGEPVWDEGFLSLMEEESRILSEYYAIYEQSLATEYYSEEFFSTYGAQMAEVFVQLVAHRQKIAAYAGYDSYPQFAYDFYYRRDYSAQEAVAYLSSIPEHMESLYRTANLADLWAAQDIACTEEAIFAYGSAAANTMGGIIQEAFQFMTENAVYDIAYGANKYDVSFEVYLTSYQSPFLFMNPSMTIADQLTFVHEFGHFVNDYICSGSNAGTDVAEVHSQAMEYLSLRYGNQDTKLETLKMANSLAVYVDQGAYALFEHQVYSLPANKLNVETVHALYEQIGLQFGFDSWGWDSRDYVCIEHLFTNPLYLISYVTSNDLALQIYQKELAQSGEGLQLYLSCLESQDSYLLSFADSYGLESPFAQNRLSQVCKTLEQALQ